MSHNVERGIDMTNMQTVKLDAASFEKVAGRPATWGISPFREGKEFNLRFDITKKRWFFDIKGNSFSAKQINPRVTDIEMYKNSY
jgi:hypothetical protein